MTARRTVVDSVMGEFTEFGDVKPKELERMQRMGARIISDGFAYDGLDKAEKETLDRFVFDLFHVCADEIYFEPESHAFKLF
ncbi:MAG: hypothetical protein AAGJ87_04050, partial [Pseudomonadota bacterium]